MKAIIFFIAALVALTSYAQAQTAPSFLTVSNVLNMFPEGLEYSDSTGFLLSSFGLGTVFKVNDNGVASVLINDTRLMATLGLHIDRARNELLVVNFNPQVFYGQTVVGFTSGLMRYNLTSNTISQYTDLSSVHYSGYSGMHMANDVVTDADGNAYVTDSYAAQVWKVTPAGVATAFATDSRWVGNFSICMFLIGWMVLHKNYKLFVC